MHNVTIYGHTNNLAALLLNISLFYERIKPLGWPNFRNEKSWVPPSHPGGYFSTLGISADSKESVRKTQGKRN